MFGILSAFRLYYIYIFFKTLFLSNFVVSNCLVATILSHRYNSRTGSGETKVESHASSDTQPNQAALLLNTAPSNPETSRTKGNTVRHSPEQPVRQSTVLTSFGLVRPCVPVWYKRAAFCLELREEVKGYSEVVHKEQVRVGQSLPSDSIGLVSVVLWLL